MSCKSKSASKLTLGQSSAVVPQAPRRSHSQFG
jgi:hypothetical protein